MVISTVVMSAAVQASTTSNRQRQRVSDLDGEHDDPDAEAEEQNGRTLKAQPGSPSLRAP